MTRMKLRMDRIPEELNINGKDIAHLEKMVATLTELSQTSDLTKKLQLLIRLASTANELNPRMGYVRSENKQVPWKNLIYLSKLVPQLLNRNKHLAEEFIQKFEKNDLDALIEIFLNMQEQSKSNIQVLENMHKELSTKQEISSKWAKEIEYLTLQIKDRSKNKQDLQRLNGELARFIKGVSKKYSFNNYQEAYLKIKDLLIDSGYNLTQLTNFFNIDFNEKFHSDEELIKSLSKIRDFIKIFEKDLSVLTKKKRVVQTFLQALDNLEDMVNISNDVIEIVSASFFRISHILNNLDESNVNSTLKELQEELQKLEEAVFKLDILSKCSNQIQKIHVEKIDELKSLIFLLEQDAPCVLESKKKYAEVFAHLSLTLNSIGDVELHQKKNKKNLQKISEDLSQLHDCLTSFGERNENKISSLLNVIKMKLHFIIDNEEKQPGLKDLKNLLMQFLKDVQHDKSTLNLEYLSNLVGKVKAVTDPLFQETSHVKQITDDTQTPEINLPTIHQLTNYSFDQANIEKIYENLKSFLDNFNLASPLSRYALLQLLLEVGECCNDISPLAKLAHNTIPWMLSVSLRNRITHQAMDEIPGQIKLNNFLDLDSSSYEKQLLKKLVDICVTELVNYLGRMGAVKLSYNLMVLESFEKLPKMESYEQAKSEWQNYQSQIDPQDFYHLYTLKEYLKEAQNLLSQENESSNIVIIKKPTLNETEHNLTEEISQKLLMIALQIQRLKNVSAELVDTNIITLSSKFIYAFVGEIIRTLQLEPYKGPFQENATKQLIGKIDTIIRKRGDIAHSLLTKDEVLTESDINELMKIILPQVEITVFNLQLAHEKALLKPYEQLKTLKDYLNLTLTGLINKVNNQGSGHFNNILPLLSLVDTPKELIKFFDTEKNQVNLLNILNAIEYYATEAIEQQKALHDEYQRLLSSLRESPKLHDEAYQQLERHLRRLESDYPTQAFKAQWSNLEKLQQQITTFEKTIGTLDTCIAEASKKKIDKENLIQKIELGLKKMGIKPPEHLKVIITSLRENKHVAQIMDSNRKCKTLNLNLDKKYKDIAELINKLVTDTVDCVNKTLCKSSFNPEILGSLIKYIQNNPRLLTDPGKILNNLKQEDLHILLTFCQDYSNLDNLTLNSLKDEYFSLRNQLITLNHGVEQQQQLLFILKKNPLASDMIKVYTKSYEEKLKQIQNLTESLDKIKIFCDKDALSHIEEAVKVTQLEQARNITNYYKSEKDSIVTAGSAEKNDTSTYTLK